MYDTFSLDYDRFVDWKSRLAVEIPFILNQLQAANTRSVLDAACGTGMHAIALAQQGYTVAGADLSTGMIDRARVNAAATGVLVDFEAVGFGSLAQTFGKNAFDALICLGNSLPHLLTIADITLALADFANCLRPGGLLMIQNRNFDAVSAQRERWMEPQSYIEGETEWIFVRFYDFDPDERITFNILTLRKEGQGNWGQSVVSTYLRPLRQVELIGSLSAAGFEAAVCFGNMLGAPFYPQTSGNLVVSTRLATGSREFV